MEYSPNVMANIDALSDAEGEDGKLDTSYIRVAKNCDFYVA